VAGAIYVAIVAPLLWFVAPLLAHHLSASPITVSYLVPSLRLIPVIALVAMPFFLCRPVFEGMGRGRPGLAMSSLRYLILAAPAAWAGRTLAPGLGISPVMGLVVGLGLATAVSSLIFLTWTRRALAHVPAAAQNPTAAA